MSRRIQIQIWILFGILFANFVAQVVYFYHLYYTPQQPFPTLRSSLVMGFVFLWFLTSYFLFITRHKYGYFAMGMYLFVEFAFYLWNFTLAGLRPGYGWFFHLSERDPILWAVFFIGYLSFVASGYFLALLIYPRLGTHIHRGRNSSAR